MFKLFRMNCTPSAFLHLVQAGATRQQFCHWLLCCLSASDYFIIHCTIVVQWLSMNVSWKLGITGLQDVVCELKQVLRSSALLDIPVSSVKTHHLMTKILMKSSMCHGILLL